MSLPPATARDERNFDELSSDDDDDNDDRRAADGDDNDAAESDGGSGVDEVYADMMDELPVLSDAERIEEEEGEDLYDDTVLSKYVQTP
jgi:hypothetical protein